MESTAINSVYVVNCETKDGYIYVDKIFADERKAIENCKFLNEVYKNTGRKFWIDERIVY